MPWPPAFPVQSTAAGFLLAPYCDPGADEAPGDINIRIYCFVDIYLLKLIISYLPGLIISEILAIEKTTNDKSTVNSHTLIKISNFF